VDNDSIAHAFERELLATGKQPGTIKIYMEAVRFFRDHSGDKPFTEVDRADVQDFMADQLENRKPATAHTRYRSLRRFFGWLETDMELIERSPMARMKPPRVPQRDEPVLTSEEIWRLLDVTSGKDAESRRDRAIISLLLDSGLRIGELAGLHLTDVDLRRYDQVTVIGKGRKERRVPFGRDTAKDLMRYDSLARPKFPDAHRYDEYWLGHRGPLTTGGVDQMLKRRGKEAGIPDLHAHRFRHSFAHLHLANGGGEGDLMRLAGWSTRSMLDRYASAPASQRARDAYRSPRDGLRNGGDRRRS
jgi:site-specific recombinase XerD